MLPLKYHYIIEMFNSQEQLTDLVWILYCSRGIEHGEFKDEFIIVIFTFEILVSWKLWDYYKGFPCPLCSPGTLVFHITSSHRNDNLPLGFS